jgi:hypothetical protein
VYYIQYCRMLPINTINTYIYIIQRARHVSGITFIQYAQIKTPKPKPSAINIIDN